MNTLDVPGSSEAPFWSPWATVGWGFLVATVFVVVQVIATIVWGVILSLTGSEIGVDAFAEQATMNGDLGAHRNARRGQSRGNCGGDTRILN